MANLLYLQLSDRSGFSCLKKSPMAPLELKSASESSGVASLLIMASRAPLCLASAGKEAAGCTTKEEPITIKISAAWLHS